MRTFLTLHLIIWSFCNAAWAQEFVVDLTPQEADHVRGTVRASDLAINDIAYFYPWALCERDGRLYLPSDARPSDATDTTSFLIKFTMQPSKLLAGELLPPSKAGEFDEGDVLYVIGQLAETGSFVSSTFCDEAQRISKRELEFYPVASIDGHNTLSSLADDLRNRSFSFTR